MLIFSIGLFFCEYRLLSAIFFESEEKRKRDLRCILGITIYGVYRSRFEYPRRSDGISARACRDSLRSEAEACIGHGDRGSARTRTCSLGETR